MDSSVSPKDEIWFLSVCRHVSTGHYVFLQHINAHINVQEHNMPVIYPNIFLKYSIFLKNNEVKFVA